MDADRLPEAAIDIDLRPWREDDLDLMHRLLGDPAMTAHLGGPEPPERLRARLERYLAMTPAEGRTYVVTLGPERLPVGSIVWWQHPIRGEPAVEIGWAVLPEFQGRGIATRATARCMETAAAETTCRTIHATPAVDNGASNAVCRKLGFEIVETAELEYPAGHWMTCNDWSFDLDRLRADP
jgi:RimJ/RimL family protein N-acetyltransferase